MRENKFRFFDKEEKEYYYSDSYNYISLFFEHIEYYYPNNHDEIEQYTGLNDKNYKEIYEGDIIKYYDFTSVYASEYIGEVKFKHGEFGIESEYSNKLISLHFNEDFANRKTEIIGNKHQNPELLKRSKA